MIRKWLGWVALGCFMLNLSLPASAQDTHFGSVRAKAGVFFPTEDEMNDFNEVWFAVGFSVDMPRLPFMGGHTRLDVELFSHSMGGSRGVITPITLNQVFSASVTGETSVQFILGLGAYVVDAIGPSKTVFGGRAAVNLILNDAFSVEASYHLTDRVRGGPRANGLAVTLGYQF